MSEKYYVLLRAPRKPNPPAPLPYEGMGVISLSPSRREVWREVPSIAIDAFLHPLRKPRFKSKVSQYLYPNMKKN